MGNSKVVFRGKGYVVTRLTYEEDMALMDPVEAMIRRLEDEILFGNLTGYRFEILGVHPTFGGFMKRSQRDADEARRQNDIYGV